MTEKDYEERINQARTEIAKAQENLLNTYITQLKKQYEEFNPQKRELLLEGLEKLVQSVESGKLSIEEDTQYRKRKYLKRNLAFNHEEARKIREKESLTQEELVKEICGEASGGLKQQIGRYERGENKPANPPRGDFAPKYLAWLKKHGYNPFNL